MKTTFHESTHVILQIGTYYYSNLGNPLSCTRVLAYTRRMKKVFSSTHMLPWLIDVCEGLAPTIQHFKLGENSIR